MRKNMSNKRSNSEQVDKLFQDTLDSLPIGLFIVVDGKFKLVNPELLKITGYSKDELLDSNPLKLVYEEDRISAKNNAINMLKGKLLTPYEYRSIHKSGRIDWTMETVKSIQYRGQRAALGYFVDITERKNAEEEIKRYRDHLEELVQERTAELARQSEIITQQSQEMLELSTPVMQVWQGILVAPLIGSLDSQRTQHFMERLLERIVETNSPVALVDITGVPIIDTQTAQHLIDTITAVRLLGAQVILTGVRPAIAQTLVHLGIDLSGIVTRSSLAAGLQVAMSNLGGKFVSETPMNRKEV